MWGLQLCAARFPSRFAVFLQITYYSNAVKMNGVSNATKLYCSCSIIIIDYGIVKNYEKYVHRLFDKKKKNMQHL